MAHSRPSLILVTRYCKNFRFCSVVFMSDTTLNAASFQRRLNHTIHLPSCGVGTLFNRLIPALPPRLCRGSHFIRRLPYTYNRKGWDKVRSVVCGAVFGVRSVLRCPFCVGAFSLSKRQKKRPPQRAVNSCGVAYSVILAFVGVNPIATAFSLMRLICFVTLSGRTLKYVAIALYP